VLVFGPDGREVPAQFDNGKVIFLARAPAVGFAVYDIRPPMGPADVTRMKATQSSLENDRYQIKLDEHGDVSSIFDKKVKRELLSAPIRLAISTDNPRQWPAWNMDLKTS